jgi:hypothetical protein
MSDVSVQATVSFIVFAQAPKLLVSVADDERNFVAAA